MENWQNIGGLDCLVQDVPNKNSNDTRKNPCVILFHGYGADASDLYPLHEVLKTKGPCTWIFPQGPLSVMIGAGFSGRAWFQIDIASMEKAIREGKHRDLADTNPPGFREASQKAFKFYEACCEKYTAVVVGGFSQGAMLATEVTLRSVEKPSGLVVLSGALVDKKNWQTLSETCEGIPYFQSHGENDAILNPEGAEQLEALFSAAGMQGSLLSFKGGHEIPPIVVNELNRFLKTLGL